MCIKSCIDFGKEALKEKDIRGKSVIEVGSCDINGSLRPIAEAFGPSYYVGVDIQIGRGVDQICKAEDLISKFGYNKFDILICTELLEHVLNWKKVMHNMKHVLKPNGKLLITTRSKGFRYHGYPYDFWRYEISDMQFIFSDFDIEIIKNDPQEPGVFLMARKPYMFCENKLNNYKIYSIIQRKKSSIVVNNIYWWCRHRPLFCILNFCSQTLPKPVGHVIKGIFPETVRKKLIRWVVPKG